MNESHDKAVKAYSKYTESNVKWESDVHDSYKNGFLIIIWKISCYLKYTNNYV